MVRITPCATVRFIVLTAILCTFLLLLVDLTKKGELSKLEEFGYQAASLVDAQKWGYRGIAPKKGIYDEKQISLQSLEFIDNHVPPDLECGEMIKRGNYSDDAGDTAVIEAWRWRLKDRRVLERALECVNILKRGGGQKSEFAVPRDDKVPLAFSFVIHSNLALLEQQLQILFRPYHSFCLYVDVKAPHFVHHTIRTVVQCFKGRYPNATFFMVPDPQSIYWGHISLLDADMRCLELLLEKNSEWKYYINLAGSELPSLPVEAMEARIDSELQGRSLVNSKVITPNFKNRYTYSYHLPTKKELEAKKKKTYGHKYVMEPMRTKGKKKSPPPFNLTIFKAMKNVVLNRSFSEFAIHHPVAKKFHEFVSDTYVPDELFFQTLVRIGVVRDADGRDKVVQDKRPKELIGLLGINVTARYSNWNTKDHRAQDPCQGGFQRNICHFSVFDLPFLATLGDRHLFLNKFNLGQYPLAIVCWRKHLDNFTMGRYNP